MSWPLRQPTLPEPEPEPEPGTWQALPTRHTGRRAGPAPILSSAGPPVVEGSSSTGRERERFGLDLSGQEDKTSPGADKEEDAQSGGSHSFTKRRSVTTGQPPCI